MEIKKLHPVDMPKKFKEYGIGVWINSEEEEKLFLAIFDPSVRKKLSAQDRFKVSEAKSAFVELISKEVANRL